MGRDSSPKSPTTGLEQRILHSGKYGLVSINVRYVATNKFKMSFFPENGTFSFVNKIWDYEICKSLHAVVFTFYTASQLYGICCCKFSFLILQSVKINYE